MYSTRGVNLMPTIFDSQGNAWNLTRRMPIPPNIPSKVRLRGGNIAPRFSDIIGAESVWAATWRVFDWNGWWKPQIDAIATLGNAVRIFGNTAVISNGVLTLDAYLAQWKQALDYCAAKGLYVIPVGGDFGHWGPTRWWQSIQIYTVWAELLANYTNIVGVDITNEPADKIYPGTGEMYSESEDYRQLTWKLASVIRSRTSFPVTCSHGILSAAGWTAMSSDVEMLLDFADYLDFHVYYTGSPSDMAPVWAFPWAQGKQMIFGEFGIYPLTLTSHERTEQISAIQTQVAADSRIAGGLIWTIFDQDPTTGATGLFDGVPGSPRPEISGPFATFPTTR